MPWILRTAAVSGPKRARENKGLDFEQVEDSPKEKHKDWDKELQRAKEKLEKWKKKNRSLRF